MSAAKYRRRNWLRQAHATNPLCLYCKEETWFLEPENRNLIKNTNSFPKRLMATVDHFVPLAAGGSDTNDNYRVACRRCNCAKGCEVPE